MNYTSLVTGGAGFIGSHIVDVLLEIGHKVIVLDDLSGGFKENINVNAEFIRGSIVDSLTVNKLFEKFKFDYVFHLAAYAAEGLSHFIRRFNYMNNVIGSVNLINCSIEHNIKCIVFTSSIAVYGSAQVPMTENMKPEPEDPYGIAKYSVELDLAAARRLWGLNFIIFRPHNVYGERQNIGDKYRNVIGIFMNQLLQGKPCTFFGDGNQTRAFTHVADVAPIIAKSVHVPDAYGEVFNIGADVPYSIKELLKAVQKAINKDTGVVHLESRREVIHAFSNHDKARRIFNYEPKISLREGLKRMADWVSNVGPRSSKEFKEIEIHKNLPSAWLHSIGP